MVKLTSILIAFILIFVSDVIGHGEGKCYVIGNTHFTIFHFTPNTSSDPDDAGNRPEYVGGHGHIRKKVGDDKIYSWGYWSKLGYEIVKHIPDRIQGWRKCMVVDPPPVVVEPKPELPPVVVPKPEPTPKTQTPEPEQETADEKEENKGEETMEDGDRAREPTGTETPAEETKQTPAKEPVTPPSRSVTWRIPKGLSVIHLPRRVSGIERISDLLALLEHGYILISLSPDGVFKLHAHNYPSWDDRIFEPHEAFICIAHQAMEIAIEGDPIPEEVPLRDGWNLVGFPSELEFEIAAMLEDVIEFDTERQAWISNQAHVMFEVGRGYLVYVDEEELIP